PRFAEEKHPRRTPYGAHQKGESPAEAGLSPFQQAPGRGRETGRSYMPMPMSPMPPMPPIGGIIGFSSASSPTMQSVVSIRPATEAAFWSAVRVTLVGSSTPISTMSPYSPEAAL